MEKRTKKFNVTVITDDVSGHPLQMEAAAIRKISHSMIEVDGVIISAAEAGMTFADVTEIESYQDVSPLTQRWSVERTDQSWAVNDDLGTAVAVYDSQESAEALAANHNAALIRATENLADASRNALVVLAALKICNEREPYFSNSTVYALLNAHAQLMDALPKISPATLFYKNFSPRVTELVEERPE